MLPEELGLSSARLSWLLSSLLPPWSIRPQDKTWNSSVISTRAKVSNSYLWYACPLDWCYDWSMLQDASCHQTDAAKEFHLILTYMHQHKLLLAPQHSTIPERVFQPTTTSASQKPWSAGVPNTMGYISSSALSAVWQWLQNNAQTS